MNEWTKIAAEALATAKTLAPRKTPAAAPASKRPDDVAAAQEFVAAWGRQLEKTGLPAQVWVHAAETWATEQAEEALDIRALIGAARLVIRRMESGTAEQRLWLAKWRAQRLQANYEALGLGDGGVEVPTIAPNQTESAPQLSPGQLIAEAKKRAQNAK